MNDEFLKLMRYGVHAANLDLQINIRRFWAEELAKPRYADPKRLLRYGAKVYSQNEEDGIIQEIFKRIGTARRTFIEFGVETGVECNTVRLLLEGWRGLWIEMMQQFTTEMRRTLSGFLSSGQLTLREATVTAENINGLFEEAGFLGEIDCLSIDIDSNDYWVWKAIEVVKPRLVVIEYNATLRPPMSLVVPYSAPERGNKTNYFGASLEALVRLGREKGYSIVGCNFSGSNAFFVRDDLCGDHFLNPGTAEEHYEPARYFFSSLTVGHHPRVGPFVSV